jgi:hypothetical protein
MWATSKVGFEGIYSATVDAATANQPASLLCNTAQTYDYDALLNAL